MFIPSQVTRPRIALCQKFSFVIYEGYGALQEISHTFQKYVMKHVVWPAPDRCHNA